MVDGDDGHEPDDGLGIEGDGVPARVEEEPVRLRRLRPREANVEDDAGGPRIRGGAVVAQRVVGEVGRVGAVGLLREDLRRQVLRCPAEGLACLWPDGGELCEAEVGEEDVGVVVLGAEQDVLRLDVSMGDAAVVEVREGGEEVGHHAPGVVLGEGGELYEAVEEVAAFDELHDDVELVIGDVDSPDGDDGGVADFSEDAGFVEDVVGGQGAQI
mmetsp:Transcript_29627/g.95535  ORF Transcript_29627/g.95535 Transcript_29627/m.95535 type:complete len:214 (-) Transcript_29627:641-1282(-)